MIRGTGRAMLLGICILHNFVCGGVIINVGGEGGKVCVGGREGIYV